MDFKPASKNLILALASGSFALTALAQWQWIDKEGRKVFSDRAPPTDIPAKNILKQPTTPKTLTFSSAPISTVAPSATASAPEVKASTPKISGKDTELEAKKKSAEEETAAKNKAEEERLAKAKEENCKQAQKGLVTLQSGIRMSTLNAKGEREFMDDAARATEAKRLQGISDKDCKK